MASFVAELMFLGACKKGTFVGFQVVSGGCEEFCLVKYNTM
jgi:hypothetical protein